MLSCRLQAHEPTPEDGGLAPRSRKQRRPLRGRRPLCLALLLLPHNLLHESFEVRIINRGDAGIRLPLSRHC